MPKPTITNTFSVNTKIKSSEVNQNFIDNRTFSGCSLYLSGDTAITNNTWTDLSWANETFDTDGYHDGANPKRITALIDCYLFFILQCNFLANATGVRALRLKKNDTANFYGYDLRENIGGTDTTTILTTKILYLSATDFIEAQVYQNSGGNLDVSGSESLTHFSCYFMGI